MFQIGYRLEGLEVPASAPGGRIVIDCVAFDPATNRFLLVEGKSGKPVAVDGPPPAVILIDDQSDDTEFDSIVSAALVAEVAQDRDLVGCPDLAARAIPYLRTQRYQALKARMTGTVAPEPTTDQGSLFDEIDLAAELEKADTGESDVDESGGEGQ